MKKTNLKRMYLMPYIQVQEVFLEQVIATSVPYNPGSGTVVVVDPEEIGVGADGGDIQIGSD